MSFFRSSHPRWAVLAIAASLVGASLIPVPARADPPGRLFYEIIVTDPGTKSQGWHGVLYDADGNPIEAAPGARVTFPEEAFVARVGEFVNVACNEPWDSCGMIRTDMVDEVVNDIMDSSSWVYRRYVVAEGTRSEGWNGILLHDGVEIPADSATPIDTPMGPFRPVVPTGYDEGFLPASWMQP